MFLALAWLRMTDNASGVNLSSPAISCFPHDGYRDRWEWVSHTWPETVGDLALDNLDAWVGIAVLPEKAASDLAACQNERSGHARMQGEVRGYPALHDDGVCCPGRRCDSRSFGRGDSDRVHGFIWDRDRRVRHARPFFLADLR